MKKDKEYILMSIREEYYNDIILGKKRYEYRKVYRKGETIAFIYVSKTKKSVLGIIDFDYPIIGNKKTISEISENENKGSYNDMMSYLNKDIGYAIPIKRIREIQEVTLEELKEKFPKFSPPQSYFLLDNKKELLDYLQSKKIVNTINFN